MNREVRLALCGAFIVILTMLGVVDAQDAQELCVVRPWIADSLQMTAEQRTQAAAAVSEFHRHISSSIKSYPRGGQDSEGTRIRRRMEASINDAQRSAVEKLRKVLTEEQGQRVSELRRADQATNSVTLKVGVLMDVINPPGLSELKLTSGQAARFRALQLQAEEDSLKRFSDPDREVQRLRTESEQYLVGILTNEQRAAREATIKRSEKKPPTLFFNSELFSSYELNRNSISEGNLFVMQPHRSLTEWLIEKKADGTKSPPMMWIWHPEDELVSSIAISPNKRWLASIGTTAAGLKGQVELRLWDTETGKLAQHVAIRGPGYRAFVRFITSECLQYGAGVFGR